MWAVVVFLLTVVCWHGSAALPPPCDYQYFYTNNGNNWKIAKYDFTKFNYVKLQVRACRNAQIVLLRNHHYYWYSYQIVLDGKYTHPWLRSWITKGVGRPPKSYKWGKQLSCNQYRWFYITWDWRGCIRVYSGCKTLLFTWCDRYQWTSRLYKIKAVGVRTPGTLGNWRIYNPKCKPQCCYSHGNKYCIQPNTNCQCFTQQNVIQPIPGQTYLKSCQGNLQFDARQHVCTCNHAAQTPCNYP